MNKFNQRFSLVVPTYNEADNIRDFCSSVVDVLSKNSIDFEVIIVDDDSPDRTWEIAQKISEKEKRIKVIRRVNKKGLATAVVEGWENAQGDILGVIDSDLQQPPETIPLLLDRLKDESVDIVIASRNTRDNLVSKRNIWRRFISSSGAFICVFLLPKLARLSDPMSGFFVLRKEVIRNKVLSPWGYKILLEVLVKGDYKKISEVSYVFVERKKGESKAGIKQFLISFFYFLKLGVESRRGLKSLR
ncbi:MAG: polyprenol monophosphomannose synthase [Candidatus Omnitrophica bacterium]|jgi:dolichol-phosphate mannosyltransferase|nr:polyprenol monophosphomannose synthase [Candidatus Omnitrophota bacterium]